MAVVNDDLFISRIARWVHLGKHKGGKAFYCESDRQWAEDLLVYIREQDWTVNEDDRSS